MKRRIALLAVFLGVTIVVYALLSWEWQPRSGRVVMAPASPFMRTATRIRRYAELRASKNHRQAQRLGHAVFPWRKRQGVNAAVQARGVVIATGNKYFALTVHTIRILRLLSCNLPVEVFYIGANDLDDESVRFLNGMPNVRTVNIESIYDNSVLKLRTWDLKPFAMLASAFQEVILMDADVLFVQNPEVMFAYPEYKETGALFFVDRDLRLKETDYKSQFNTLIPQPHSALLMGTKMYKNQADHQQESGVVVIDKRRRLCGLLAACRLNFGHEKDVIRSITYGDKETFWLGFEIAREPYVFYDQAYGPGLIGDFAKIASQEDLVLWGHLAHFDKDSRLLWFNDGVVKSKGKSLTELAVFKAMSNTGRWFLNVLRPQTMLPFPPELKAFLDNAKAIWDPQPLNRK